LPPALVIDSRERNPKKKRAADPNSEGTPGNAKAVRSETVSLVVQIGDDKAISGEAQLGASDPQTLSVRGLLDDETLRLTLSGEKAAGTLIASRQEQAFNGVLRLSEVTVDGLQHPATAYETKLQLNRQPAARTR
jgi:hypothetical protein